MSKITDTEKYQLLNFQLNLTRVREIFRLFDKYNISPVLIKGLAAAMYYPKPFQRAFSDIDLAVDPDQYETAKSIIKTNYFNVDLHRGLRHLDVINWQILFKNSEIITLEDTNIRVLCLEDHLRVLCIHWLNDGGADRTRLWDIYFALSNKGEDFSWEKFYSGVNSRRKKWLMTVILLVKDYFGLELNTKPSEDEKFILPGWVKQEIEHDWKNDTRLKPLNDVLNSPKELFVQIKKRVPPNNLQAIVETESEISHSRRCLPRMKNVLFRSKHSIINVIKSNEK